MRELLKNFNDTDIGNGIELRCTPQLKLVSGRWELVKDSYALWLVLPHHDVRYIGLLKVEDNKIISYKRTILSSHLFLSKDAIGLSACILKHLPKDCIVVVKLRNVTPLFKRKQKSKVIRCQMLLGRLNETVRKDN